jgi:hypothetical protein
MPGHGQRRCGKPRGAAQHLCPFGVGQRGERAFQQQTYGAIGQITLECAATRAQHL